MIKKDFSPFEQVIGYHFRDPELLTRAFLHRSYLNEHKDVALPHNERLEFLGDAIVELVVTDYLFKKYPDKTEGEMTAYRAALVNTISLSAAASALGMNDYLLLSKGESKDTGRARQYILANTYESLVGSLYLDGGYEAALRFIGATLLDKTDTIVAQNLWQDAKSHFQEQAQDIAGITPSYQVLEEVGPDHDKKFTVGLYLGAELVAKGTGHSKQEAEQAAAHAGLELKGWQ